MTTYGSQRCWADIQAANPAISATQLQPGQVITLPLIGPPARRNSTIAEVSNYVVQPGDTLTKIAKRYFRTETAWRELYKVNRDRIGPNPNHLNTGLALKLVAAAR